MLWTTGFLTHDSIITRVYGVTAADFCSIVTLTTKLYSTYVKLTFEKYFTGPGRVPDSTGAHVLVHPTNANSPQRELTRDAFPTSQGVHLCNSKGTP